MCNPTVYHARRYTVRFITSIGIVRELLRYRRFSFANESTCYCNYSKERHGGEISYIVPYWLNVPTGIAYWHDGICWRIQQDENNPMKWFSVIPQEKFPEKEAAVASSYLDALSDSEKKYISLLRQGCQSQQARDVLPLATKSELVMTGFEDDWKYLIDIRHEEVTGKVHPDMKLLMAQLIRVAEAEYILNDIMNPTSKSK